VRRFTPGLVGTALAVLAIVMATVFIMGPSDDIGGEVWQRGFLAGEQYRFMPGNRYRLERWGCFGVGDTLESGTWTRLGDTVSLVPAAPGKSAYLMLQSVSGDERLLVRAGEEAFERVD